MYFTCTQYKQNQYVYISILILECDYEYNRFIAKNLLFWKPKYDINYI